MNDQQKLQLIKDNLQSYPDFPKKGIVFRDIFSVLAVPAASSALLSLLLSAVRAHCPDVQVIAGLDARGFLFGLPLAEALGKPFIPIRKKGKLPGPTHSVSYKLEYGEDVFEIKADSIAAGDKVVLVDDLLATGGTLEAANKLVALAGGSVGLNLVCLELVELKGRQRFSSPVHAVVPL